MKCTKCGNPTNHKSSICIACNFDNKFGSEGTPKVSPKDNPSLNPASRPIAKKQNQGIKRGQAGTDLSQNPYLLDDLELLLNAQISHIFSLVKEGKLKLAAHRINITNEALKNAKHKKHS